MSFERRLLIASVAVWTVIAIATLVLGAPLGHDEAAVAVLSREDVPAWIYRSRGLVVLAELGVLAGGAEWQLRLPIAVIDVGVVLAVFAVGRAVFDATAGAWAAAVVAGAHWMVLRSTELLGDLPATACVLAALAVVATELDRATGPRWRLALAAPLLAAAFYVRYGSAPVIAIAGSAALALWWRAIVRRPGPAIAAVALFAALLVPHVVHSVAATDHALGILEISRGTPERAFIGDGLVTYLTANPFRFYGALVAPVAVAGLVAIVRVRRRAPVFLWLVAVGQIVALGLQSHGQPRYVFIATALLVVLGAGAVREVRAMVPRRLALGLVIAAWLGAAVAVVPLHRAVVAQRAPIVAVAGAVRRDAGGEPCVVDARRVQQLAWYSGCSPTGSAADPGPSAARYLVWQSAAPLDVPPGAVPIAERAWRLARSAMTDR